MFKRLLMVLTALCSVFGCVGLDEGDLGQSASDKQKPVESKIVNGSLDAAHEGVVAVLGDGLCTGSIIAPNMVLTAAHCITSEGRWSVPEMVSVGSALDGQPTESAQVVRYAMHPGWSRSETPENDVALLLLDRPLRTQTMQMYLGDLSALRGETIQAVGFGHTNGWAQTGYGDRRATTMVIEEVYEGSFDAATPSGRQTDTCQGDSGGPAIVTLNRVEFIVGVVSSGPVGCTGLTHYAALQDKTGWMNQAIEELVEGRGPSTPTSPGQEREENDDSELDYEPGNGNPNPSADQGRDSCRYAFNGFCEEGDYCDYGTDTTDCEAAQAEPATPPPVEQSADSCWYAFNGVCDEGNGCDYGTDTTDCNNAQNEPTAPPPADESSDSCWYAFNGVCDEGYECDYGTDTTDCENPAAQPAQMDEYPSNSCDYAYNGTCDEGYGCDYGTDTYDCENASTMQPDDDDYRDDSCRYAFDGECDEGAACLYGTDTSDCGGY